MRVTLITEVVKTTEVVGEEEAVDAVEAGDEVVTTKLLTRLLTMIRAQQMQQMTTAMPHHRLRTMASHQTLLDEAARTIEAEEVVVADVVGAEVIDHRLPKISLKLQPRQLINRSNLIQSRRKERKRSKLKRSHKVSQRWTLVAPW